MLEKALNLIKSFEGCKLNAYADLGGRWSIGWGSTGAGIGPGVVWTQAEADEKLLEHVISDQRQLKQLVRVPLTENQEAALLSFTYNLGIYNFKRSGLLRKLNQQDYKGAADQFLLWNQVNHYVVPGLTKRREQERAVFLGLQQAAG